MKRERREAVGPLLLFVATLLLYVTALRDAGFIWDDDLYVTSNAALRTVAGLERIWLAPAALPQYYPLVHTTFWIEYRLWGLTPFGFHAVNALLHAASAVLVVFVLRRLSVSGAWLGAALWALHPVQVESVAWIAERKNVLSGVFYFAAALTFLRCLGIGSSKHDGADSEAPRSSAGLYALGALFFLGALLSKTVTATLPAALLLILIWKKRRVRPSDAIALAPLFVAGAAFGLATAWIERHHVGAEGQAWNLGLVERVLIAGRAVWFYAAKLLVPAQLAFVYPRWEIDPASVLAYAFPAAALAVLAGLWRLRRRIGAGPIVAVLYFGGTLVPALGFLNVFPMRYSFVADHFQYLASLGILALFAAIGTLAVDRIPKAPSWLGPSLAAGVLLVASGLTWRQCRIYRDVEALWRDTLAKNPSAWMAHTNLGLLLVRQGRIDEGIAHYRESIRLEPDNVEARLDLGEVLQRQGRSDEAIEVLTALVADRPDHPVARYNLATALCRRERYVDALPQFEAALRIQPEFAEAAYNLGTADLKLRRLSDAERWLREAIRLRPGYGLARSNLALVLEQTGRAEEARAQRLAGLRMRAWSLATQDNPRARNGEEAVRLAEQVCRETGWSDPEALDTAAAAYAEAGRFQEAVVAAEKALAVLGPTGPEDLRNAIAERLSGFRSSRPYRDPESIPRPGAFTTVTEKD